MRGELEAALMHAALSGTGPASLLTLCAAPRYLVVVEKHAVLQRLVDDEFHLLVNCILVTAMGMPDVATRAFVHAILDALPHLIPVARALGHAKMQQAPCSGCTVAFSMHDSVHAHAVVDWSFIHACECACSCSGCLEPDSMHDSVRAHAVVDWNPSGVAILAAYKYGCQRMQEAAPYTAPQLRWLATRGALLHSVPDLVLQVREVACTRLLPDNV